MPLSDRENGVAQPAGLNAIRIFPNGHRDLGRAHHGRLRQLGGDDYKYVPVRRLALFIEESLYRGLKWAVFEPNDEPLWAQIRLAAGAFMNNLFRQGAFQGKKPREAYFVKCDARPPRRTTSTSASSTSSVGFAPLKPAEFVVIYDRSSWPARCRSDRTAERQRRRHGSIHRQHRTASTPTRTSSSA